MPSLKPLLISSPDLRPSLMSLLPEMDRAGLLEKMVTTIALDLETDFGKTVNKLCRFLPGFEKGMMRRKVPAFLRGKIESYAARELVRLLAGRFTDASLTHAVWRWSERGFDQKVSRDYAGRVPCIYGMDHSSLHTFRRHKKAGGLCVLRQVIVHPKKLSEVSSQLRTAYPEQQTDYDRLLENEAPKLRAHQEEEHRLSDLIIANSNLVRDSFIEAGYPASRIVAVPTGCPAAVTQPANSGRGERPLNFLFAGALTARKGIYQLLEAWAALGRKPDAELHLAGSRGPARLSEKLPPGCRWLGNLSQTDLAETLRQADVFVFPTLLEGRAHVVLEALSSGLPVITTRASGCVPPVGHEDNGLIVKEGDVNSLKSALQWCLENRRRLPEMGARSLDQAKSWTENDAGKAHAQILSSFLEENKIR